MIKIEDIKRTVERLLKEEYGITISKTSHFLTHEQLIKISLVKSNKTFLSISDRKYKTKDIDADFLCLILYSNFLILYEELSDYLFTMDYSINYLRVTKTSSYVDNRTNKVKFIDKEKIILSLKDIIDLTEINLYH